MAERGAAGLMTQRRLGEDPPPPEAPEEEPLATEEESSVPPEITTAAPVRPPLRLDGPSDTELRQRQDAWLAERARHEAYRRTHRPDAPMDSGARS